MQGEIIDARGKLTTPSLIDPHIHLDKVNVSDVVRPNKSGTLKEAIETCGDQKRIYTIDDIVARGEDVVKRRLKTERSPFARTLTLIQSVPASA